jgi:tRNA(fMet)-specific endonuclease VapC
MYLLDTDHLSVLQWQNMPDYGHLTARMSVQPASSIYVSVVSFHEQSVGWHAYLQQARQRTDVIHGYAELGGIIDDFAAMQVLPFDDAAADQFDRLRSQRLRIQLMDLRIAAIALANQFVLLTRNAVDFSRVPGLIIEDWTRP